MDMTGDLADDELELVVLWADGELAAGSPQAAQAEQLLQHNGAARQIAADMQATKAALRELVVGEAAAGAVKADLSMVRGRVMTKIVPAAARPDQPLKASPAGLWDWLRQLGFGKVSVAFGAAAALATWMWMAAVPGKAPVAATQAVAEEANPSDSPVIIEEMDIDSGTISVVPGATADQPTVIWHFAEVKAGDG